MPRKKLSLYIWDEFCPDYSNGLAFAIAESESDARAEIIASRKCEVYHWGPVKVYPVNEKIAFSVSGGS